MMTAPGTPKGPPHAASTERRSTARLDRVFLERSGYRQRRLRDALRMLPLAGAVLWIIPVFWTGASASPVGNGAALVYIFSVWFGLIAVGFLLSRFVRFEDDPEASDTDAADASATQDDGVAR